MKNETTQTTKPLYAAYRIGNLVKWQDNKEGDECYLTITGMVLNGEIWVEWEWQDGEKDYTDCSINSISGIKLTEDLLLKIGFEHSKITDKFYTKGNSFGISTADNKFRFIQGNFVCQLVLKDLEYIHELQNLYYTLTGKELSLSGI
ncbi:MAG: hypothetical protein WC389_22050 [Lutibacter sp.]|jgi:hypothetical protein